MPAAGQPFIVSSTWVVSLPIVGVLPRAAVAGAKGVADFAKVYTVCGSTQALSSVRPVPAPSTMSPTPPRKLQVVRAARPARARRGRAGRRRREAGAPAGGSTARIVESITAAIVERRLMPGTKLAEQRIADIFDVSRTLVRQALNQLSRDRLVTLEPARGARVAEPSVEEARQVFEVRNMLEAAMVRRLCATHHAGAGGRAARPSARRAGGRRAHRRLGPHAAAGRLPRRARAGCSATRRWPTCSPSCSSRCSLIALMYQSSHSAGHSYDEHVRDRRCARTARRARRDAPDGRPPAARRAQPATRSARVPNSAGAAPPGQLRGLKP